MFITPEELNTHLNDDQIEAIGAGVDNVIITSAIDGAEAEAYGYLSRFNRDAIFNASGAERNALLVIFVKDIAVWHFIALSNPGTEFKVREKRYNAAIAWLKGVQAGDVVPNLPAPEPIEGQSGGFAWGSNPKRGNHI